MFDRHIEGGLLEALAAEEMGCIVFSPLAQGLLTDRYLGGIPADSRAGRPTGYLRPEHVTEARVQQARRLSEIARNRGQTLAQLALAWVLRHPGVTSALIGASRPAHIEDAVGALARPDLSEAELARIDEVLAPSSAPTDGDGMRHENRARTTAQRPTADERM
jgi:L-glyceraldehyde 3-phosphate reductase